MINNLITTIEFQLRQLKITRQQEQHEQTKLSGTGCKQIVKRENSRFDLQTRTQIMTKLNGEENELN